VLKSSKHQAAAQTFVTFLGSAQAQSVFEKFGFSPAR
jgi:ABC-type molybdate transport system substrate-binding protein